jgi:hypothetical protein
MLFVYARVCAYESVLYAPKASKWRKTIAHVLSNDWIDALVYWIQNYRNKEESFTSPFE